ncbi:acyl-CoA thioesterase domain-containing protein [Arthrobacter sp. 08Y14]|uniref:acyl-CoA thioesterase domain-containing protein n=1 Tax=Arthrobacter sp. 08Y14 TaxID=2058885 RepID=UPI000CE36B2C|nr:acyl-CoA thioesterase domain-containing protein [Arthrobacter sp. 08Y14]
MDDEALFDIAAREAGEVFSPLPRSRSGWGTGLLRGMAVTGLLARGTEACAAGLGAEARFSPVRFTADLFRPAPAVESRVVTSVVRRGRKLCVIDAVLIQDDVAVARSSTVLAAALPPPGGTVWQQDDSELPQAPQLQPTSEDLRLFYAGETGWAQVDDAPESPARRGVWHLALPVVRGEAASGFVVAAYVADAANIVSNWGDTGLQHINADITLALSRVPDAGGVGLFALDRHEAGGAAIGTSAMFDNRGRCGTVTTVALGNAEHAVNPKTKAPLERVSG